MKERYSKLATRKADSRCSLSAREEPGVPNEAAAISEGSGEPTFADQSKIRRHCVGPWKRWRN